MTCLRRAVGTADMAVGRARCRRAGSAGRSKCSKRKMDELEVSSANDTQGCAYCIVHWKRVEWMCRSRVSTTRAK